MLYDYTYRLLNCSSVGVAGVLTHDKHGLNNVNVIDAQEGRFTHDYKNIKEKLF
jgi:hypothetical protein